MYEIRSLDSSQGRNQCLTPGSALAEDQQPGLWYKCGGEELFSPPAPLQMEEDHLQEGTSLPRLPASPPAAGTDEQMFSFCLAHHLNILQALMWLSISLLSK